MTDKPKTDPLRFLSPSERALVREEEAIEQSVRDGYLSQSEANEQMRELHRDAREYLREEAQRAYDRVMEDGSW